MDFSDVFVNLYQKVLILEKNTFFVSDQKIRDAIRVLKDVYLPNPLWKQMPVVDVADFNEPSHRIAYLHKYAMCYTGMVCDLLQKAIQNNNEIYQFINSKRRLTLCSVGGGPGTDVIGVLAAIYARCQYIPCSVTVLDYCEKWSTTLKLLIREIQCGNSKSLKSMVSAPQFRCEYLGANLLDDVAKNTSARRAVQAADFLTMVKFISAAACQSTKRMVEDIFSCMKPGAMLLFIDNAAGGFREMMQEAANNTGMTTVYGPLMHYDYENVKYSVTKFNYTSQSKTKVAVQIWKKSQAYCYNTTHELRNDYFAYSRIRTRGGENVRVLSNQQPIRTDNQNNGCCSII